MAEPQALIREIRAALERDPRVNLHRYPIAVDCAADGTIVLEGESESVGAKKIALELAASIPGCTAIADRLRVKPSVRMGDGAIRDRVRDNLLEEQSLARYGIYVRNGRASKLVRESAAPRGDYIEVAVEAGVVTLNGQVESLAHKRLAGVLTWWVPGTCDLVNGIEVEPPQEDSDDEIRDSVRTALEKDRLVRSDSIRVTSKNAVVTLDGAAVNARQAAMAEADAWYIFGVDRVINRLQTLE